MGFQRTIDYVNKAVRTSAVLTNSYVAGTSLGAETSNPTPIDRCNQMVVNVSLTLGNLTSAQVKIELSPDNSTFYQETASSVSGGTSTESLMEHSFTATGNYRIAVPITTRVVKISAKGTGDVTNSLMAVNCDIGIS